MRTPLELACFYWASEEIEIEDFIEQIQTEAWNEAIEAAAENAKVHLYCTDISVEPKVDKQSILKLKK